MDKLGDSLLNKIYSSRYDKKPFSLIAISNIAIKMVYIYSTVNNNNIFYKGINTQVLSQPGLGTL